MESNQTEQRKEIMQIENSLRELTDFIKHNNIHIIGISEEERNKRAKKLFKEIIWESK